VNRWGVRIAGLIMVLIFLLIFAHLFRTLKMLQRERVPHPATTATAKP
jgi:Na+-transporting methylmalonyl-CoA/oxaloacetate decarboxylase gamma subunit